MTSLTPAPAACVAIDSVLLIDGDNDPHFPADFEVGERTLVRVFLRQGAKIPRVLERRLEAAENLVAVIATKTAGNAADFVMALHAGILHATLPMHLPFTIVTNDQGLSVIAQEFQRVGRQTTLWTSHVREADALPEESPRRSRSGRSRGGRGRARQRPAVREPAAVPAQVSAPVRGAGEPEATDGLNGRVAAAYAERLRRIKDPPSRLKTLLSDIVNRAKPAGCDPQAVVDLLVGAGVITIDAAGRVKRP